MYALSSVFIDNSTRIHCAAWATNLNSLAQPNHFHHSLLPPLLFATKLSTLSITLVSTKRLSEYLAAVFQKEIDADKEAAAIIVVREEPVQQTETAALSMQVNLSHRLYLPVMYPSLNSFVISSPSQTSLIIDQGSIFWAPGTGKISLNQRIARALGRPFQRISSGGVPDETEIRSHRSIWSRPCHSSTP